MDYGCHGNPERDLLSVVEVVRKGGLEGVQVLQPLLPVKEALLGSQEVGIGLDAVDVHHDNEDV